MESSIHLNASISATPPPIKGSPRKEKKRTFKVRSFNYSHKQPAAQSHLNRLGKGVGGNLFSGEHYWLSTDGWLLIGSLGCNGCNEDRLGMVFSNRIQQVGYDNFIRVISAFCLQPTPNGSALGESREREEEGGGRDRAKESTTEPRLAHY